MERPKLSTQNAPTSGKRRRNVAEERRGEEEIDRALQQSVEAIFKGGVGYLGGPCLVGLAREGLVWDSLLDALGLDKDKQTWILLFVFWDKCHLSSCLGQTPSNGLEGLQRITS